MHSAWGKSYIISYFTLIKNWSRYIVTKGKKKYACYLILHQKKCFYERKEKNNTFEKKG